MLRQTQFGKVELTRLEVLFGHLIFPRAIGSSELAGAVHGSVPLLGDPCWMFVKGEPTGTTILDRAPQFAESTHIVFREIFRVAQEMKGCQKGFEPAWFRDSSFRFPLSGDPTDLDILHLGLMEVWQAF